MLPDARTGIFRLRPDSDDIVVHITSGKRFIVMGTRSGRIGLFPTDSTSSIIPSTQLGKGTTAVAGTKSHLPAISFKLESSDILTLQLSLDDSLLYVSALSGVWVADLSLPTDTIELIYLLAVTEMQASVVVEDKLIVTATTQGGISLHSFEKDTLTVGPGEVIDSRQNGNWKLAVEGSSLAFTFGSETVTIFNTVNREKFESKLSPQSGDVSNVLVVKPDSIPIVGEQGVVVAQRDVISIFSVKEGELELVFQFRDAINKLQCSSVDLDGKYLLSISSDNFSRRDRLELYDLSFLRPKSAGLSPLRRWDISRLTAEVEESRIFFVKNRDLLSFLLTGSGASLWEPAVRDQWFAVMPNFEVLNKNEPFHEREEEFDFNQHANPEEVRRTINRYKKSDHVVFDFVSQERNERKRDNEDIVMRDDEAETKRNDEKLLPFLQPVKKWSEKFEACPVGCAKVTFFSESAQRVLERRLRGN